MAVKVKGKKCGRMSVPVCRDAKGKFKSQGRKTTTKKKGKRRMKKGAVCAPKTLRKYKGKCGCKTRGGGFKFVKSSRCKRGRRK